MLFHMCQWNFLVTITREPSIGSQPTWRRSSFAIDQVCIGSRVIILLGSNTSGEDPKCSDSVLDITPSDHQSYLGFHSPDGNAHNCGHVPLNKKEEKKKNEAMKNFVDIVSATKSVE